jgi:hypothetical protein
MYVIIFYIIVSYGYGPYQGPYIITLILMDSIAFVKTSKKAEAEVPNPTRNPRFLAYPNPNPTRGFILNPIQHYF